MAAAPTDPDEVEHRIKAERHRDWWAMTQSDRARVLSYEAGYDDGVADGYDHGYTEGQTDAISKLLRSLPDHILGLMASLGGAT